MHNLTTAYKPMAEGRKTWLRTKPWKSERARGKSARGRMDTESFSGGDFSSEIEDVEVKEKVEVEVEVEIEAEAEVDVDVDI